MKRKLTPEEDLKATQKKNFMCIICGATFRGIEKPNGDIISWTLKVVPANLTRAAVCMDCEVRTAEKNHRKAMKHPQAIIYV